MKGTLINYLISLQSIADLIEDNVYCAPVSSKIGNEFITVSRVSISTYHNNAGITGATEETWQIDCYAETDYKAEQIKEAVRRGLDAYSGDMGSFTIYSTVMESVRDLTDIEGDASEDSVHRKSMDFNIVRNETVENRVTTTTTTT